jgi:hypothetical protein
MNESTASPTAARTGGQELQIRQRYEVLSIANDMLIAVWFIAGSLLFFSADTATMGTWMFLIGSIELAVRPMIRLTRRLHLHVMQVPADSGQDF